MSRRGGGRPKYSSRPFYTSVLLITLITVYALFLKRADAPDAPLQSPLRARAQDEDCREVHHAADKCAFIRANCDDDEAGLIQYLTFYYCTLQHAQPVAFIIMVIWLGLLFTTIGIAASDFFSVNLSTIASILGLSESLAGVTFLAFGNGSPDVFSTFAAMSSNSGSMAVGELIGAAGFITAVVAGSMALVREFKVSKKTFVRDICFFIAAVSFTMVFLADGKLLLWECLLMIGFYIFYVIVVVGWHWFSTRRQRKRAREAASRGHYFGAPGQPSDELEPYRDEEEEDGDATVGRRRSTADDADIDALEAGPRIEVDGPLSPLAEDEDRERHVAAEMTSSMRVNRARGRRSNTTITPIRPSLVGALEFRSVLSSLQKARNMRLAPLNRSYSDYQRTYGDSVSASTSTPGRLLDTASLDPSTYPPPSTYRDRALSTGDVPENLTSSHLQHPAARTSSPSTSLKDGRLAPPHTEGGPPLLLPDFGEQQPSSPKQLQLQIPSPTSRASQTSSPAMSPFPGLTESPMPVTPHVGPHIEESNFMLPNSVTHRDTNSIAELGHDDHSPKPVRWWPYGILPPPHVLLGTLFPTLQAWREKSIWDKFVSLVSVPSIFLLVTTLPVVETESNDDESDEGIVDPPATGDIGHTAPPVAVERHASLEPETEWQEYRRSTRSVRSRRSTNTSSPALIAIDSSDDLRRPSIEIAAPDSAVQAQPVKPAPGVASDSTERDEPVSWNRWLVALQVFTGPLFTVCIIWANMQEGLEDPGRLLIKMILCSLLASLILLGILLLTTSEDRKPKYHFLLCFLGFIISVAWISTVAGEVVGVLKAFGVILGISEAILGLTIFAVGNSLGDLVADVTVARLGYPVMALSACFGGPMLNILLGIGIGGAWMTTQAANKKHAQHPHKPIKYKPYHIEVGGTLLISAITVLITLIVLLIVVPSNKWVMSRKIGWGLITIWTISTVVNLVVEMTGVWKDVA